MTDKWQPIETAPNNGDEFLAYFPDNDRNKIAIVSRPDFENAPHSYRCPIDNCYYVNNPTHWMPLPEPPKEAEEV